MSEKLIDTDGENLAIRDFLSLYGGANSVTVKRMRDHMAASGWYGLWPSWAETEQGHLAKAGAQDWLRHLFALEAAASHPKEQDK